MSGPAADGHDSEPVGSIAEEAFKLFRAVATDNTSDDSHGGEHVCSTGWCPVCQVVGFVRQHPEAVTAVTLSAAALVQSLRGLVDAALAPREEQ